MTCKRTWKNSSFSLRRNVVKDHVEELPSIVKLRLRVFILFVNLQMRDKTWFLDLATSKICMKQQRNAS